MRATVSKARSNQNELLGSKRVGSVSESVAERLGLRPGVQLRLDPIEPASGTADGTANGGPTADGLDGPAMGARSGAITVTEVHPDEAVDVRLAKAARRPLDATAPFEARIRSTVPATTLPVPEARRRDEVVETCWLPDAGLAAADVLFCAPHAGDMERNTHRAATFAARAFGRERAALWSVRHFGADSFDRWHVTSSRVHPASYPALGRVAGRTYPLAVSVHLWNGSDVLVGGLADAADRERVAAAVADAIGGCRDVETEDGKYMARTGANVVNRLTPDRARGIQVELPAYVAQRYRKRVGEALGHVATELV
jgi:hypothetical protein